MQTTTVSGGLKRIATATNYLYTNWLVNSPYEPEHQHGKEIFLDKQNILNWEHFNMELSVPVKTLSPLT